MNKELVVVGTQVRQAGADRNLLDDLRTASEQSLYVFAKAVMGMNKFVIHLHKPLCDWLSRVPPRKKLLLMPRDTFKTTMARCLGMHITIQQPATNPYFPGRDGRNIRLLYAAENERRALSRIGWIRRQYESNALFRVLWPDHVWKSLADTSTWTLSHFTLPRTEDYPESTFEAAGVDTGSTGGHYDVLIKDDLIGLRSRKQPKLMDAAIEWWKTSHSLSNDPQQSLDFVFGTRWASEDLYTWIGDNELSYDTRLYSAVSRPRDLPPTGDDDKDLLFPERLSRALLEDLKRKYGPFYYLNYENRPFGEGTTAFTMELCGLFHLEGETVVFDTPEPTARVLSIIEEGNKAAKAPEKRKPFYRTTPEERVELWQQMIQNWRKERFHRLEIR